MQGNEKEQIEDAPASGNREQICALCGKPFIPFRAGVKYCSSVCNKKAWTLKRSKKRARKHKLETRLCAFCGKPFLFDSNVHNKRFCSDECKRKNESEERSNNRLRRDAFVLTNISSTLPSELDELRGEKGSRYFKKLFTLEPEKQFAEMESWTADDHADAMSYLNSNGAITERVGDEEFAKDLLLRNSLETPTVFDEEDFFGS